MSEDKQGYAPIHVAPHAESREAQDARAVHEERERREEHAQEIADDRSFHDVAALEDLKEGVMVTVTVGGKSVVLVRDGEQVAALGGKCPHKGAPMEQGAACHSREHGPVLVCPWHKAVFSQLTGKVVEPVAFAPLPRYPVEILDGRVLVRAKPEQDPEPTPRQTEESVLIVGGGAAAASAAYTLREEGFGGPITMVGDEPEPPYDRTTLSKTMLLGDPAKTRAPLLLPEDYYAHRDIILHQGRVTQFEAATHTATLTNGTTLRADHVLLAPGGKPRRPKDIPGLELSGVLQLYTQADARKIAEVVTPEQAVILIGGGLICLEVASALRQKGVGVTIVTHQPVPMEAQFGREIGLRLLQLHEENGVAFISNTGVKCIYAASAEGKTVGGVELEDGMKMPCTHVLVATGTEPDMDFVAELPKTAKGALIVDRAMHVAPGVENRPRGVYGAGDAVAVQDGAYLWPSAHWRPAEIEGRIAAQSMMGKPAREMPVPWYWTQQFGKKIEYLGWGEKFDKVILQGDLRDFKFLAFCYRGGRVVALISSGRQKDMARAVVDFERFVREEGKALEGGVF